MNKPKLLCAPPDSIFMYRGAAMDMIQIKIKKDTNIISYIKLIKEFDKSISSNGISISDIKRRIEENQFVYGFDLDAGDWMYIEKMTEYEWHSRFLRLIKELVTIGADVTVYHNNEVVSLELIENWIHTIKDISEETDAESELEELEDMSIIEPYGYLWTTEQADWGVIIEDYSYSIVNTKTHQILLIEDTELNNKVAAMMIMMGNARFDNLDQAFNT